jgi:hypothetical protein
VYGRAAGGGWLAQKKSWSPRDLAELRGPAGMKSPGLPPSAMYAARIAFHVSAASGHSRPPGMGSVFAVVNAPLDATPSARPLIMVGMKTFL